MLSACGGGEGIDAPIACGNNTDCPAGYSCVMEAAGKFCRMTGGADAGSTPDTCPAGDAGAAPTTHITVHPDVATNSTAAVFQFTATPSGGGFLCTLDNGAPAPCTSPDNLTVSVGTHTLKVQAVGSGLCPPVDKTGDSFTWIVDQTAPMVTNFTCPTPTGNQISIGFGSNDAMATFVCTLDGHSAACTAPAVNYTNLTQGPHTATVVAKDLAGNVSAASTCQFTVSGVSPNAHFTNCPASAVLVDNISLNIAADVAGTTFECSQSQNGQFTSCTSPFVLSSLAEGDYTVFVRGTAGGITDAVPGQCAFTIDAIPPTVTLVPPSPDEGATTGSTVQFKYTSDAANATFKCGIDLGGPPTDDCDAAGKQIDNLTLGDHAFSIIAIDKAGVPSAVLVRHFKVGPGPGVTVTLVPATGPVDGVVGPDGDVVGPSGTIEFKVVSGATDVKFDCTTSGPGFDQTLPNCTSPVPWTGLADDDYEFDLVATNTTTNETSTVKRTFHVDATPPVLTFVGPTDIVGNPVSLLYTATDLVESVPITGSCNIDGSVFKCDAGIPLVVSLEDGSHDVFITAQDVWGNKTSTPFIRTILVDATGPLITDFVGQGTTCPSSNDPDGKANNFFTFTTNEQVSELQCTIDGKPSNCQMISGTQGQVRWSNLADGNHTVVIVATDVVGNPGPAPNGFSFTWTVDREPPTVTFVTPPSLSDPSGPSGTIGFGIVDHSLGATHNVEIVDCKIDLGTNSTVTDCNSTIVLTDGGGDNADFTASFSSLHDQNQEGGSFHHTITIFAQDACGNVNAVNLGDGAAEAWTVDSTPDDIAFDPFTLTNSTNGGGPLNVITSATGQVNFTLSDDHSNTNPPNPDEPGPTFTTCAITGTATKTQDCACDASLDLGVTWHCHAQYAGTDGTATITLDAVDAVGNPSQPVDANLSWTIDSSAPTVVFGTTPQQNGCTVDGNPNSVVVSKGAGTVVFTSSETSNATPTQVGQATYTCVLIDLTTGESKVVPCPQTGSAPSTFTFSFDVADQSGPAPHITSGHTYQLQVTAVDEVKNTTVASRFWAVDNDTPTVTFVAPNSTPGFTNVASEVNANGTGDSTANGTITTTDVFGGSTAATTWPQNTCSIGGVTVNCDLTLWDVFTLNLSEGSHTVTVHSQDCVNNNADYTLTFYLDRTPPNPVVTNLGPFQSATGSATVHFQVDEPGSGLSNVENVFCALDNTAGFKVNDTGTGLPATTGTPPQPFTACSSVGTYSNASSALPTAAGTGSFTADLTMNGLSPGRHLLRFIASDHSHHLSSEQFVEFTVDFDGTSSGAFGHVVLIGQDFVASNTATQNIIGNAAQLSRATTFGRPLHALVASFGSRDVDGSETANAESAMCTRLQAWHPGCTCGGLPTDCVFFDEQTFSPTDPLLLSTNPTDAGSFANRVLGKDIVLFTDVDNVNSTSAISNLGGSSAWSTELTTLATDGIILIVTSGGTDDPGAGFVATPTYLLTQDLVDVTADLEGQRSAFLECNSTDPLTARTDDEVANDDRWIDGFGQPTNGIRFINHERTASDTNMVSEVWDDDNGFRICPFLCPPGPTGAVVLDKWFPQRTGIGPVYARVIDGADGSFPTVGYFQQPGQGLKDVTHCRLNGDRTVSHDVVAQAIVSIGTNVDLGDEQFTSRYQSLYNLAPNEAVNIGVTIDTSTTNSTIDIPESSPGFQPSAIVLSSGCSTLSWPQNAAPWDDSGVNLTFGAQCQLGDGSSRVIAMAVDQGGNVRRYALKIPDVGAFPDDASWSEWQVVASPQITIQPNNLPALPESVVKTVNVNAATMLGNVWFDEMRNGLTAPPFNTFFWPAPPTFNGYPTGLRTSVQLGYSQQGDPFFTTSLFINELDGPPGNGQILIAPTAFLPHIGGLAAAGTVGSEAQPSTLTWGTSQLEWSGSSTTLTFADANAALAALFNVTNTCGTTGFQGGVTWVLMFTPTAGQTSQPLPLIPVDQNMACTPGGSPTATFTPLELVVFGSSTTTDILAHRDTLTSFQLVASPNDVDGKRSAIRLSASINAAILNQGVVGVVDR